MLDALVESAETLAQLGSWAWHPGTDRIAWSDNLYRIYGLAPGELTPTLDYVLERTHPYDRERFESAVELARREGLPRPFEYRIVLPDGATRHLRGNAAVTAKTRGRPRGMVGSVQDITERARADRAVAAHLAVARALADWHAFERGATGLLNNLGGALDCTAGVLWLPAGDVLVAQVFWQSGTTDLQQLESIVRQLRLPLRVGLPGEVWRTAEPTTVSTLNDDPRFPLEAVASLGGAIALPAVHAGEVLAVLELYFCPPASPEGGDWLQDSLIGIGAQVGAFLARRRGALRPRALTPREVQVLQLAAEGCDGRRIAEHLVVSPATVRTHFEHIYAKYGVSDRAAAVAKGLRDGLIE